MEGVVLAIALIVLAAAMGESIIEFVGSPVVNLILVDNEANKSKRVVVFNFLSAFLGVGIALNFNLGVFALLKAFGAVPVLDSVLTGILVGRGSNYVHDFVKKFILAKVE